MSKVALQAVLCYNRAINIVVPQRCWKHPVAWIRLDWRHIMDTLPPHAFESNPPFVTIPLTRGLVAIVDPEDADLLSYKWYSTSKYYAARNIKNQRVLMHRIVLERKLQRSIQEGMMADHVNGNRQDNRRTNLREVTLTQNARNSGVQKNNTTQYIGVSYNKRQKRYLARIGSDGKLLGGFDNALDASFCYDRAALELWGEYARLNHPIEEVLAWQSPSHQLHSTNTSGYRGVTRVKRDGRWQASYRHGHKLLYLGTFNTPDEAARAYDRTVLELRGEKAILNFPREDYEL